MKELWVVGTEFAGGLVLLGLMFGGLVAVVRWQARVMREMQDRAGAINDRQMREAEEMYRRLRDEPEDGDEWRHG